MRTARPGAGKLRLWKFHPTPLPRPGVGRGAALAGLAARPARPGAGRGAMSGGGSSARSGGAAAGPGLAPLGAGRPRDHLGQRCGRRPPAPRCPSAHGAPGGRPGSRCPPADPCSAGEPRARESSIARWGRDGPPGAPAVRQSSVGRSCRKARISAGPALGLVCTSLSLNSRFVYTQILHIFLFLYQ